MPALMELVWKVAPPVVSGIGGVIGAVWRLTQSLDRRVENLERFIKEKYPEQHAALLKEIDTVYKELQARSKERVDTRRLQTKLSERYFAIETRVENLEKTLAALNESFVEHAKGQNDQWQEISRALGQLEGWLRATSSSRRSSQEFSAPVLPPKGR